MDLAVDVDVDFDDDLVVLDVFVAVLLLGAALAAGLVTFPLIVFAGALALGFVFGLVTFEAFAADNFAEALVVFLVVVALAGAFLTLLVDLAGAALVAAFFVLDAVFTTFAVLVGDFLAEGFVTFAAVVLGANSFLASLTGPEGPLGWAKSPFSTPFLNVALNNESKLGAFTAKLSRTNFLMAWREEPALSFKVEIAETIMSLYVAFEATTWGFDLAIFEVCGRKKHLVMEKQKTNNTLDI